MRGAGRLDPVTCMRVLGLGEAASAVQIKQAYRALAQRLHPDKSGDDEESRRRFIEVCQAYRCLIKAARLAEQGAMLGVCCACREFGEVLIVLDGHTRCPACTLRTQPRPLLPMPVLIVKRCWVSILLLVLCGLLLFVDRPTGAFVAGLTALVSLAVTCIRVRYCARPRDRMAVVTDRAPGV